MSNKSCPLCYGKKFRGVRCVQCGWKSNEKTKNEIVEEELKDGY